jgi:hypothetical protein
MEFNSTNFNVQVGRQRRETITGIHTRISASPQFARFCSIFLPEAKLLPICQVSLIVDLKATTHSKSQGRDHGNPTEINRNVQNVNNVDTHTYQLVHALS